MAAVPESGFLLIADITGYTAYLALGEIEHARAVRQLGAGVERLS